MLCLFCLPIENEIPEGKHQCRICGHFQFENDALDEDDDDNDSLISLSEVDETTIESRFQTGPWDFVLGGPVNPGIEKTGVYFIGGLPGSGKTTLSLQILASIIRTTEERPAFYLGNEQEQKVIKIMAKRMLLHDVYSRLLVPRVRGAISYPLSDKLLDLNPICIIQDSLPGNEGISKTESQRMLDGFKTVAETFDCPIFVINHVNSEGEMAGWMALEHFVTGVYMLIPAVSRNRPERRFSALKNRTGRTCSMILEMGDVGLFGHNEKCDCEVCKKERKN
jgi:predicted ATP-dependent serine protease